MRQRVAFLVRDSAIYGVGAALNKAITLFTFPILARHFSVGDFGRIDLFNTALVLAVTLLVFGQDSAVARYFYDTEDRQVRRQVVSQSLMLQAGLLALIMPAIWFGSDALARKLNLGGDGTTVVRLMCLQLPFFVLINFAQGLLKWTFRRGPFLLISVGSTAATLLGVLAAMSAGVLDVIGLFAVYLGVRAIFGLLGLWFVREWLTLPVGWSQLRQMIPFAAPFGVICVASSVLPLLERQVVADLLGDDALGMFAAGAKVAMLMAVLINAFETSWGPFSLALHKQHDAGATFALVFKLAAMLFCTAALALAAFGEAIVVLLGSHKYEGAGVVVFALAMSLALQAIGAVTEVGIVFAKRSYLKLYAYALMVGIAAVAMPLLGGAFGIVGVAWGSLVAYAGKVSLEAWLAQRAHPVGWSYRGPVLICLMTLAIGLLHQALFARLSWAGLQMVPLAGLVLLVAAAWILLLDADERRRAHNLLMRGRSSRQGAAG
jgi:O-antigen/teichoic acid export membrane protein